MSQVWYCYGAEGGLGIFLVVLEYSGSALGSMGEFTSTSQALFLAPLLCFYGYVGCVPGRKTACVSVIKCPSPLPLQQVNLS